MKRLLVILALACGAFVGTARADDAHDTHAADRAACAAAMNADPSFEKEIIKVANEKADQEIAAKHLAAADQIATNEKHVILAYAAMWIAAAGFVIFLWRRQQLLKEQLARLERELAAATRDESKPS